MHTVAHSTSWVRLLIVGAILMAACRSTKAKMPTVEVRTDVAPVARLFHLRVPIVAARWCVWPPKGSSLLPGPSDLQVFAWVTCEPGVLETFPRSAWERDKIALPRDIAQALVPTELLGDASAAEALQLRADDGVIWGDSLTAPPVSGKILGVSERPGVAISGIRRGDWLFLSYSSF